MTTIGLAVLGGVSVLLAGSLLWGALLPLNLRVFPIAPWAIVPMAAYLWFYWTLIAGAIGSPRTALRRREWLRANPVSARIWMMALLSGLAGYAALLTLVALMARLVTLPASPPIAMPADMPSITAFLLLVMSAVVAGVTEEAGFRGYMLGPIERRYGLLAAILVTGTAFGILHFPNHPNQVWTMLPYYIAVSAVYGGMTSASNSIMPAVVLHATGNVWSLTRLWITGRPEWQIVAEPGPLIWATGVDTAFLILAGGLVLLSAATWASCLATARLRQRAGHVVQARQPSH
jgi:membrane protease YdiL (CAAX protease family)